MAYLGTTPKDVRSFGKAQFDFTATQGQTVFTGADDDSKTLGFTEGQIQVHVNGVLLDGSDYSTSNNNTVTLSAAANANDVLTVLALQTDIPNSDYVPISGGTFSGDVTVSGSFTSQGIDDNATSTAMTLDGSGNLMVGKTADVLNNTGGFLDNRGSFTFTRDNATVGYINRLNSDGTILDLRKDGGTVGSIGSYGTELYIASPAGTDAAIRMGYDTIAPANNSGANRDAAINLGASNNRFKDLYLSGGVYLGGTGSANKLDAYEEGTFSATLGRSGFTTSFSNLSLERYVKIGRIVFVDMTLSFTASGYNADYSRIDGLPFAVSGDGCIASYSSGQIALNANGGKGIFGSGSNSLYLYDANNNGQDANWRVSGWYYTAA